MPSRDHNLLFGLAAMRAGAITREQLLEAVAAGLAEEGADLADALVRRGTLTDAQRAAAERDAEEGLVERHGGSTTVPGPADPDKTPPIPDSSRTFAPPVPPAVKYDLGAEIGRGGLGRVVEARDMELGRTVALKIHLGDAAGEMLERFRREARVTARLEHPNVVPVHEAGVLPGEPARAFFSMKRITGRDLAHVIADLREGREGEWTLRKLVETFRDVCRAVAFAHSRGVIHRDLKPSNVMVGEFGEVLVVDWGLAKVSGEEDAVASRLRAAAALEGAAGLTMEGEVLGTPSYMPPEQAAGRIAEVDERSDVYSLGAILYEILTWKPPFVGKNAMETLERVRTQAPRPPSTVVAIPVSEAEAAQATAAEQRAMELHAAPPSVPPELEAICLRALAKRKEDRFAGAAELAAGVEAWLAGALERERRERLAAEHVERARAELERWRAGRREGAVALREAHRALLALGPAEPAPKRLAAWAQEDRARETQMNAARALASAMSSLSAALANVERHPEARRLFAELHWDRFLESEEAEDAAEMLLRRRAAEEMNDGALDARLRGDGTLTVRTVAYPCACLRDGRDVAPAELLVTGFHPWSGRRAAGHEAESCPELEPAGPLRMRVHAAACRPDPAPGARVWAWRYEERDGALIPVTPPAAGEPAPARLVEEVFGESPYRPQGGGLFVGVTPIEARPWPMGSWLLLVEAAGRVPVRLPLAVARLEDAAAEVALFRPEEIPAGFLQISAGKFRYQGDRGNPNSGALQTPHVPDFFVARHPVTAREYLAFLDELDPAAAAARVPRGTERGGPAWPRLPSGRYAIPTAAFLAAAPRDLLPAETRLQHAQADWEDDWPALGTGWSDAAAFAAWRSRRDARLFTIPHEVLWEKAFRGPDARTFPWGRRLDPARCNLSGSIPGAVRPCRIGDFPEDESPWGIRGLAGNATDNCLNDGGRRFSSWRATRGGGWAHTGFAARATYRSGSRIGFAGYSHAFRLAAPVRLDSREEAAAWAGMLDGE